jgi:EmrB/QacA subfamily drug resistance transporter
MRTFLRKNRKWITLFTVASSLLMILLDGTVVNLAIPKILVDFKATIAQMEWVNNAYLLTFAVFLITLGRLGDQFGRKKFFMGGLVLFVVGSFLCGHSQNVSQLVFLRVIQGIGGAAMMPATLSLLVANFEKKERGIALGVWGAVAGLAIVLGPIIGGYLTDSGLGSGINSFLGISQLWRYVFYINIPVGIVAFLLATLIPESMDTAKKHTIDFLGIILSAASIFLLTYGFIEGQKYGWLHPNNQFILFGKEVVLVSIGNIGAIPIIFLFSIILGIIFIFYESRGIADPLLDLGLFKKRNFSVGSFSGAVLSFAMMGAFFILPLYLEIVLGFSAIKAGVTILPLAIAIMISAPVVGRLSDKIGAKYFIIAGMAVMVFGFYLLSFLKVNTTESELILPFVVTGIGIGLSMSPLANITLLDIPESEAGGASGVFSTTRQIGSVMGIAILGAFLQSQLATNIDKNLQTIQGLPVDTRQAIVAVTKNGNYLNQQSAVETQLKADMEKEIKAEIQKAMAVSSVQTSQFLDPSLAEKVQSEAAAALQKQLITKFQKIGTEIGTQSKQSFTDSIDLTVKIAALIALFGTVSAFAFKNRRV